MLTQTGFGTKASNIHYYPEESEALELTARMAERWYEWLSRVFDHALKKRQPIILYADHPDFEQTTALSPSAHKNDTIHTKDRDEHLLTPLCSLRFMRWKGSG